MILLSVRLAPFAGIKDRTIRFKEGLNVICGENDVGKSTVLKAIESVFFDTIKPSAHSLEGKALRKQIPFGGDHAHVAVEFSVNGGRYVLEKTWGKGSACRLEMPDGSVLVSEDRIQGELSRILPAKPATFKNVLLAKQNKLEASVDGLREDKESLHSLGDILRKTLSASDGVSVDSLKAKLSARLTQAFKRWDREASRPQVPKGGASGRYVKDVGPVAQAWQIKEDLKRQLNDTRVLETAFGEKQRALADCTRALAEAVTFIDANKSFVGSLKDRNALELRLDSCKKRSADINAHIVAWMAAESRLIVMEPDIDRVKAVVENLKRELVQAQEAADRKSQANRFVQINGVNEKVSELAKDFQQLKKVTTQDVDELRNAIQQLECLLASLAASKLRLTLTVRSDAELSVQKDFYAVESIRLSPAFPFSLEAAGRITVSSDMFDLSVLSGDGNMDELDAKLVHAEQQKQAELTRLGVLSLEEALAHANRFQAAELQLNAEKKALQTLLRTDSFEDLKARYESAEAAAACRDRMIIQNELSEASAELGKKQADWAQATQEIKHLKLKYEIESPLGLIELLSEIKIEEKHFLSELAKLPAAVEPAQQQSLLIDFERAEKEQRRLSDSIVGLSAEVGDLKARLPEQSSEETEREYQDAQKTFEKELRQAKALQRIHDLVGNLDAQEIDVYTDLKNRLERKVGLMSRNRYREAAMSEALPESFTRHDGVPVPFSVLSSGTRDSFALALRLSLSEYFLQDEQGFVAMDDPMVAIDPARRPIVSEILRDFASNHQLLLFTCHPDHADLLQGHRIEMV